MNLFIVALYSLILFFPNTAYSQDTPEEIFKFFDKRSHSYYSYADWMKKDASHLPKLLNYPEQSKMICENLHKTITDDLKYTIFLVKRSVDVFQKFAVKDDYCRQKYIEGYLDYKARVENHRGTEPTSTITLFDYFDEPDIDAFLATYKKYVCAIPPNNTVNSWQYIYKKDYGARSNRERETQVLTCKK